ncbi:hypothetical protein [Halalkalicoccus ordinarius]
MNECDLCGKAFLTERAKYGHLSMCPENHERTTPEGWAASSHGRWGSDRR